VIPPEVVDLELELDPRPTIVAREEGTVYCRLQACTKGMYIVRLQMCDCAIGQIAGLRLADKLAAFYEE
jgi:hypothetical protein